MCDLMWSRPSEDYGNEESTESFVFNRQSGVSYFFSYQAVCSFLERNDLLSLVTAHPRQEDGYKLYKRTPSTRWLSLMSVFSAPNYRDAYENKGAILEFDGKTVHFRQFASSPHPYWLPDFTDAFTWSLPFVAKRMTEIARALVDPEAEPSRESSASSYQAAWLLAEILDLPQRRSEIQDQEDFEMVEA